MHVGVTVARVKMRLVCCQPMKLVTSAGHRLEMPSPKFLQFFVSVCSDNTNLEFPNYPYDDVEIPKSSFVSGKSCNPAYVKYFEKGKHYFMTYDREFDSYIRYDGLSELFKMADDGIS